MFPSTSSSHPLSGSLPVEFTAPYAALTKKYNCLQPNRSVLKTQESTSPRTLESLATGPSPCGL
ncbi:hypothetical protein PGTUg99_035728 [Puccinia graminis f. sp. tritici]|uniref:Uncharacterized protein n=1 Tax=Puccinia graminis f. sp. tritici TaxID=56615 RepID=A0A5B0NQI0_PUCGR|nr:hypothetical protein PGTUg99_035728 [Puccinia graminis f. sp. tritici]